MSHIFRCFALTYEQNYIHCHLTAILRPTTLAYHFHVHVLITNLVKLIDIRSYYFFKSLLHVTYN